MIGLEGGETGGDRPRHAGGPQPHIDLVKLALGSQHGQRIDKALRQPRVIGRDGERAFALRRLAPGGNVVDDDQIDIGGEGHLAAAQLAERQHGELAALYHAMRAAEFHRDARQDLGDGGFGDIGKAGAGRLAVEPVAQQLDAELEFALADPAPRQVEHVFVVPGAIEQLRQIGAEIG